MDEYQVLIFFIGVAIAVCIYFLPAVITKKLILPNFNITPRVKLGTMLLLGLVTLIIAGFATYLVNGVLPSTSKWSFWMVIDYFYLFHFGKTKDVVQTTVPSLNPVQTNEQKPAEENIEIEPAIQFLQMAIFLCFLKSMGVFVGTRGHFMPIYIFILQLPPHPSIL